MDEQHGEQTTLRAGAVSLVGDWVASIANVAPSSSVAFTLALLVAFAGLASPLSVLIVGILMCLVAVGYSRLNNWQPHAGAPYHWAHRHPTARVKGSTQRGYGHMTETFASGLAGMTNDELVGVYASS